MVAITVILAAVIAAFVFGMAGSIQKTKIVAATAQHNGANVSVTYQGGQDHPQVDSVEFTLNGGANVTQSSPAVGYTHAWGATDGVVAGTQNHVIGVAEFNDGTRQVILDTYV